MIRRITKPKDFEKAADEIFDLFEYENKNEAHQLGLTHNKEYIINNLGDKVLLNWDFFVWINEEDDKCDAMIAFFRDKNVKFGVQIFSEYIWLSKNTKVGYKLFKEAVSFAMSQGFEYMSMSSTEKIKTSKKFEKFLYKIGFLKDYTNFITKL